MQDQMRAPLAEALERHGRKNYISFHVPGHKDRPQPGSGPEYLLGAPVFRADQTELPGLDDLHAPTGAIREAQELAADLFGAGQTWFLVNGTTSGLVAAVAAVSDPDSVVLVERACHSSVTSGLVLSGATPYYPEESFDPETGIPCGISLKAAKFAFENCRQVRAIVLTHPNYYGAYSDLPEIVKLAHGHGAAVVVDEAHGAQLPFTGQGIPSAMEAGADISVQSTHKMLGSLTQSSMLHVRGDRVDRQKLRHFISMTNSTSPSYPLMASLDLSRMRMAKEGKELWHANRERVRAAAEKIGKLHGMRVLTEFRRADESSAPAEASRLVLDGTGLGLSGLELSKILRDGYGIEAEFADGLRAILIVGSGTVDGDMAALTKALENIAERYGKEGRRGEKNLDVFRKETERGLKIRPLVEITPREAVMAPLELLDLEAAVGSVSARDVAVYPPGIPVLRPGERITEEIVEYILEAGKAGLQFHGLAEENGGIRLAAAQDRQRTMLFSGLY